MTCNLNRCHSCRHTLVNVFRIHIKIITAIRFLQTISLFHTVCRFYPVIFNFDSTLERSAGNMDLTTHMQRSFQCATLNIRSATDHIQAPIIIPLFKPGTFLYRKCIPIHRNRTAISGILNCHTILNRAASTIYRHCIVRSIASCQFSTFFPGIILNDHIR